MVLRSFWHSSWAPRVGHLLHCACLVSWIAFCLNRVYRMQQHYEDVDHGGKTGGDEELESLSLRNQGGVPHILLAWLLWLIKALPLSGLPNAAAMVVGLLGCQTFPAPPDRVESGPSVSGSGGSVHPFVCVRMVTRGLFPRLVRRNVRSHLETMAKAGVSPDRFAVEVATDAPLKLAQFFPAEAAAGLVREVLVPADYQSRRGTRNKARALQYCLEEQDAVRAGGPAGTAAAGSLLRDEDFVLHLDEETVLTERAVLGVLDFAAKGQHEIGQGLITYGAQRPPQFGSAFTAFQNRLCTVADSLRVADDLGKHKFMFRILHKPYFGMKGSYVVTKYGAEKAITWDFGPRGSVAEDAWFALVAIDKGFTIDFVDGDMMERSPFTFSDFLKQRKRWMQGIFMVATSRSISVSSRLLLASAVVIWLTLPLCTFGFLLQLWFPIPAKGHEHLLLILDLSTAFCAATAYYSYFIGYIRQFNIKRLSWLRTALVIPEIFAASLLSVILENVAVLTLWFGDWYSFYIVQKEIDTDPEAGGEHF